MIHLGRVTNFMLQMIKLFHAKLRTFVAEIGTHVPFWIKDCTYYIIIMMNIMKAIQTPLSFMRCFLPWENVTVESFN